MKKLTFILAAGLALFATSCIKEAELPEGGPASYKIAARNAIDLGEMMPGRSTTISLYATTESDGVREQLTATFRADPDAAVQIEGEDIAVLPSDCYSFTVNDVVIDRYNKDSRTGKIKITYTPNLEGGKTYVLPLIVGEVTGSAKASADPTPIIVKFFAVSGSPDKPIGSGTKNDPYNIYDAAGLMGMEEMIKHIGEDAIKTPEAYAAAAPTYFRLVNDIDMAGKDWTPINCGKPYDEKIDFDGNYKTISNLKYEGTNYGGMFGVLCGEVYNLNLIDAEITTDKSASGLLCGYCGTGDVITGIVHGCKITGVLTVDNNTIGGVAGCLSGGEIYECDVDAKITQLGDNRYYCGGIIGCGNKKVCKIHDCITRGEITSAGNLEARTYNRNIAGIAGAFDENKNAAASFTIENCISLASIHCNAVAAGIVGHLNANSWGEADMTYIHNTVKGCIAWNESITMDNSRSVSLKLSRDDYAMGGGCIMGWGCPQNTLQNCWRKPGINFLVTCPDDPESATHFKTFDQEDAGIGNPLQGIDCNYSDLWSSMYHGKAAGATETASQVAKRIGWDEAVWDLSNNIPSLKNVKSVPSQDDPEKPTGIGTKSDPYMIYTIADLMAISDKAISVSFKSREEYLAADYTYFKLGNDIDLGGIAWTPIDLGMDKEKGKKIDLNGNGKTISNFTVSGGEQVGFIKGLVGDVHDLKIEGATVTTTAKKAGILVGQASTGDNIYTYIYRCSVKGKVACETSSDSKQELSLGGLVGQQCYGEINECAADVNIEVGSVANAHYIGGIVGSLGKKELIVKNCISKGNYISSETTAFMFGGIIGCAQNVGNQIVNCISLATISCSDMAGGIIAELNKNSDGGSDRSDIEDKTSKVNGCIAWNDAIIATGTKYGSGAIIGLGGAGEFKNCWKNPGLSQFPDSPDTEAGVATSVASYNGKAAGATETASQVAKRIGWDETIWDLSGTVPVLKNIK